MHFTICLQLSAYVKRELEVLSLNISVEYGEYWTTIGSQIVMWIIMLLAKTCIYIILHSEASLNLDDVTPSVCHSLHNIVISMGPPSLKDFRDLNPD